MSPEDGYCTIGRHELEDASWRGSIPDASEQMTLAILKDKGAPIKGLTYLKLDKRFHFYSDINYNTDHIKFCWRLISDAN